MTRPAVLVALLASAMIALPAAASEGPATPPPAEATLPAAAWSAIRQVIEEQLRARRETARAFVRRAGHPRPARHPELPAGTYRTPLSRRATEFLQGAVIEGSVVQPLRLVAPDNTVLVALYTMERQPDGSWRITSCLLAPSTVRAA
jgi:hypothetical protein